LQLERRWKPEEAPANVFQFFPSCSHRDNPKIAQGVDYLVNLSILSQLQQNMRPRSSKENPASCLSILSQLQLLVIEEGGMGARTTFLLSILSQLQPDDPSRLTAAQASTFNSFPVAAPRFFDVVLALKPKAFLLFQFFPSCSKN
jgi:hypothetical protein